MSLHRPRIGAVVSWLWVPANTDVVIALVGSNRKRLMASKAEIFIERVSIECRKTKAKVITSVN